MMSSKYYDLNAIIQVIGNIYNNPSITEFNEKYIINDEDFIDDFHKIIYGTIYNLYQLGSSKIDLKTIHDFLSSRPKSEAIYNRQKGDEWLIKASENSDYNNFDYYYNRLKKMTLLRAYDNFGIDVSDIYDPDNILDLRKKEEQENYLDNASLEDIVNRIDDKISLIKGQYLDGILEESYQAGDKLDSLIEDLSKTPELGVPLYGSLINTVTRGARINKMYLRSAPTGCGKSRTMAADAAYIACNKIYYDNYGWINNGFSSPTLFISTELTIDEVQTLFLSFISGVNEEHILNGKYIGDEYDRVKEAVKILKESPLYITVLTDFSIKDIENCIKKNIRENNVEYICFDYIHSSLKILEEVSKKTKGMNLREDNILFMLSTKLKDICNNYGVFILTGTQVNGSYVDSDTPDQNLLRGAKSIADRIDFGEIILPVTAEDIEKLQTILGSNLFDKPVLKRSIYKNRRGRYKGVYLWCKSDLGTCRVEPMFATTWQYEYIDMNDLKIEMKTESAF